MKFQIGDIVRFMVPSLIIGMPTFWKRGPIVDIDERRTCRVQTGEYEYWLRSEDDMILEFRNE